LLHKQNVFDDVLAACEYLKTNKISGVTIVNGGSNGGLGAMAVGNQAEEKHGIGAVVAEVGVHDMLKFSTWTIGAGESAHCCILAIADRLSCGSLVCRLWVSVRACA